MTYLSGKRAFHKGARLFEPLLTIMTAFDAIAVATECMKTGALDRTPGHQAIEVHHFGLWIKFAMLSPTDAMTKNIVPSGFEFVFSVDPGKAAGPQIGPTMMGYKGVSMGITTAIFVAFYEQHAPWITQKFGHAAAWPPIFNFVRMIRNFIVHHDGRVHFVNSNAQPVSWHHLTYSPADDGKQVVGHDYMAVGDMLVLLIEFGDALDSAGCPFPL